MRYINSFILAARRRVAVVWTWALDEKMSQATHTSLTAGKASAQFANQATWKKREMIAEMMDDALHVVIVLVWAAWCFAIE